MYWVHFPAFQRQTTINFHHTEELSRSKSMTQATVLRMCLRMFSDRQAALYYDTTCETINFYTA